MGIISVRLYPHIEGLIIVIRFHKTARSRIKLQPPSLNEPKPCTFEESVGDRCAQANLPSFMVISILMSLPHFFNGSVLAVESNNELISSISEAGHVNRPVEWF